MKDAKEWFKEMTRLDKEPPSWHDWVKMIQQDARHSALTEAIEIHMQFPPSEHYECQNALKQLRDNHPIQPPLNPPH